MPDRQHYINASEVGTFLFCRRAWAFQRDGAPSAREPERQAGTAYHAQHGERVLTAQRMRSWARWFLLLGLVLFLLSLWASWP